MFGYLITFILVFLTHPGVAYNWFDPGVGGGMFQGLLVLLLQYPSDISTGFKNAMTIVYWVLLGVWAYIKVQIALKGA